MKLQSFFSQTKHILAQTWEGISRHRFISSTILIVTTLALFSVNAILLTNLILDTTISIINEQVDLILEMNDTTDEFKVQSMISDIRKEPGVADVSIISAANELKSFTEKYPELGDFLDSEDIENPLSASLFILTESPEFHLDIVSFLRNSEYKSLINFNLAAKNELARDRTDELMNFTRGVRMVSFALGVLLIFVSIVVIYHIIRLAIFYRETEIEIMELVGARLSVIWLPFFLEGIFFGILSAILSLLLFLIPLRSISTKLIQYLGEVNLSFSSGIFATLFPGEALSANDFFGMHFLSIFLMLAIIGVSVGILSSFIAVWRGDKKSRL